MDEAKNAILVQKNGETIKFFKYWAKYHKDGKSEGRIEITWKDDDGERHQIVKEYVGTKDKILVAIFIEAVVKYWPKFNPQVHQIVTSSGHFHDVKKRTK